MTERSLLGRLGPVLRAINSPDFAYKDPEYKKRVVNLHERITLRLLQMGSGEQVIKLRFLVNTSLNHSPVSNFKPHMIERPPENESKSGWIDENGNYIERKLTGRTYRSIGDILIVNEYLRPEGDRDEDLFKVAKRHHGLSGPEGVVTRTVFKQEAVGLLFTDHERINPARETVVFNAPPVKKELALV